MMVCRDAGSNLADAGHERISFTLIAILFFHMRNRKRYLAANKRNLENDQESI